MLCIDDPVLWSGVLEGGNRCSWPDFTVGCSDFVLRFRAVVEIRGTSSTLTLGPRMPRRLALPRDPLIPRLDGTAPVVVFVASVCHPLLQRMW